MSIAGAGRSPAPREWTTSAAINDDGKKSDIRFTSQSPFRAPACLAWSRPDAAR